MKKLFACVVALALALGGVGALADSASLSVQGTGVVEVNADQATICLGARMVDAEVQGAQAAVNECIAAIVGVLGEMGVDADHISTNAINIYPNYDYSGDIEEISGYTAYNSLLVTTKDTDNVGSLIDAAFDAGANSLDYVEFSAADTETAGRQALAMAVENAREKAQVLADAAGKRLGPIVEIREGTVSEYDLPVMTAKAEDAGTGTQVLASRQRVTGSVVIVFELNDAE